MSAEINAETIAENAVKPQSSSGDGESASMYSISEQIEAARFRAEQQSTDARVMPIRVFKIQRPGTA